MKQCDDIVALAAELGIHRRLLYRGVAAQIQKRRAVRRPLLRPSVSMSLRLVIPWRVALQQSSPPLHQPTEILNEKR